MTAQAEGTRLLTDTAAAEHAGVHVETIWAWRERGYIKAEGTPDGPRYPLDAIDALLSAGVPPREPVPEYLSPQGAASVLGVNTVTLRLKAGEGRVPFVRTPDGHRRYEADAVRAIAAKRAEPGFTGWWPEPRTD